MQFNSPGQAFAKCFQITVLFLNKLFSVMLAMNFLFPHAMCMAFTMPFLKVY